MGINVLHRPIKSAHGLWLPEHNTIIIRTGLRRIHERVVLAHELGHAIHGHNCDDPKQELQANIFAAKYLIDPDTIPKLEAWRDDEGALAAELGVTQRLLRVFFKHCWHDKLRETLHR